MRAEVPVWSPGGGGQVALVGGRWGRVRARASLCGAMTGQLKPPFGDTS